MKHEHAMSSRTLFCLSCCAALLSGCWSGVSRHVLATVLETRGEVAYQARNANRFTSLTTEAKPGAGSVLRTAPDAQVSLSLLPGALVQLSGNSDLRIEELLLTKDGNETEDGMRKRAARVRLNHGSATVVFERRDDSEVRFTVATLAVTVTANEDCVCQINVESAKTLIACARGKVYATAGGAEPAIVKAGYYQEWPGGTTRAAENDARAQAAIADSLAAEQALRALAREQIKRRAF